MVFSPFSDYVGSIEQFEVAGFGKLNCSKFDGESISGESECKTAATQLNVPYEGTENAADRPKGCYQYTKYDEYSFWEAMFWNENPEGAEDSNSSPICKKVIGNNNVKLNMNYIICIYSSSCNNYY